MAPYVEESAEEASLAAPAKRQPNLVAPEPGTFCGEPD